MSSDNQTKIVEESFADELRKAVHLLRTNKPPILSRRQKYLMTKRMTTDLADKILEDEKNA